MENSNFRICLRFIKEKGLYGEFMKYSCNKKNFYKYKDSIAIFDYLVDWYNAKGGFWYWYLIQLEYLILLMSLNFNNDNESIEYLNDLINMTFDDESDDKPESLSDDVDDLLNKYNIDLKLIEHFK